MALQVDCIDLELKRHVTEENITKEIKNHEITFKKGGTRQNRDLENILPEFGCQNTRMYVYISNVCQILTYDYSSLSKIQKNQVKLRHPVLSKGGVLKIFVFPPRILYS